MKRNFSNQENFLKNLIKGDEMAYAYLVELYYDRLCDYASNLARDGFYAEDIVQNVIVRLWQRREKLTPEISIKNYLYKSVYNEFIDLYRKNMAVTSLDKKYIEGLETVFEIQEEGDTSRLTAIINNEIDKLPPRCKETFLLSKKEGLTYIEIAEYQNVSVKTVEKQMTKALIILRLKMKENIKTILFMVFGRPKKVSV